MRSSRISPETSGASFTSVTGCTDPEALTFSVIVVYWTFANSTSISVGAPIHPIDLPIKRIAMMTTAAAISQYNTLLDFRFCLAICQVLKIDWFILVEIKYLLSEYKIVLRS